MKRLQQWAAALGVGTAVLLAMGLLATFLVVVYASVNIVDSPPRLADPAPTAAPSPNGNGNYPEQFRGGYDPNARLLGVLAVVTPLLTTIVGFYFGTRAGAGTAEAQLERTKAATTDAVNQAAASGQSAGDVRKALTDQRLMHG